MALQKDFLWGGALAAHQFEGGVLNTSKGYSVADVMTAGAHGVPREITDGVVEGKYYPNHVGIGSRTERLRVRKEKDKPLQIKSLQGFIFFLLRHS